MWIDKAFFNMVLTDNKEQESQIAQLREVGAALVQLKIDLTAQKAKDDLHLDYCRHRINALERERAILLNKAAGIVIATPEIVSTRPGTMTSPPDFGTMPSFDDLGDAEASRLGVGHDDAGNLVYRK